MPRGGNALEGEMVRMRCLIPIYKTRCDKWKQDASSVQKLDAKFI